MPWSWVLLSVMFTGSHSASFYPWRELCTVTLQLMLNCLRLSSFHHEYQTPPRPAVNPTLSIDAPLFLNRMQFSDLATSTNAMISSCWTSGRCVPIVKALVTNVGVVHMVSPILFNQLRFFCCKELFWHCLANSKTASYPLLEFAEVTVFWVLFVSGYSRLMENKKVKISDLQSAHALHAISQSLLSQ